MVLRGKYEIITVKCDDALISQGEASSAWRYQQSFAGEKEQDLQWRPRWGRVIRRGDGRGQETGWETEDVFGEPQGPCHWEWGWEDRKTEWWEFLTPGQGWTLLEGHRYPGGSWQSGKESTCQRRRHRFDPWIGKIPWRRKWQPTPVFLPGESHGQRSLVGYSP